MPAPDASRVRWLSIVGIGEDGLEGLAPPARRAIADAAIVFGGPRHLALAAPLIAGTPSAWPVPFDRAVEAVQTCRPNPTCVLASGDPFHHGVGATLLRRIDVSETTTFPGPSAFSLAAARLGWSLPDVVTLALHAQPLGTVRPFLHDGTRILAYMADGAAPQAFAAVLAGAGCGDSRLWVMEALGGPRERVRSTRADQFALDDVGALNLVAADISVKSDASILSLVPGRPETLFEHDGQISRPEARALALAALAPRRGELLWDVGAGAGSIAIEWLLADRSLRAVAIEGHEERVARIRRNAATLGASGLSVVAGRAPQAMSGLPAPSAVFVGGGATAETLALAMASLVAGGRLVAHSVTLETEALLLAFQAEHGGALTRIDIARAAALGTRRGWRPAMPLVQWSWRKP